MADTWTKLYTTMRDKMVADRGVGGTGATGARLPKTFAHDPYVMLSMIYDTVIATLKLSARDSYAFLGASPSEYRQLTGENAPGGIQVPGVTQTVSPSLATLKVEEWLTRGRKHPTDNTVRYVKPSWGFVAVPWHYGYRFGQLAEIRQLVGKWDECIRQAGIAIGGMSMQPVMTPAATREWWSAYYQLMIAIEVIQEYPHPDTWQLLAGGVKAAVKESVETIQKGAEEAAKVAGAAAAEIGKTAGMVVGGAAEGFFSQAGMTAYLAVAVAIAVAVR